MAHWMLPLLKARDRRMARKQKLEAEKSREPIRA
jgi:hypothetical protein